MEHSVVQQEALLRAVTMRIKNAQQLLSSVSPIFQAQQGGNAAEHNNTQLQQATFGAVIPYNGFRFVTELKHAG